jgi:hypothetical protein
LKSISINLLFFGKNGKNSEALQKQCKVGFFRHSGYQYKKKKTAVDKTTAVLLLLLIRSLFLTGCASAVPVSSSTSLQNYKKSSDFLPTIFGIITLFIFQRKYHINYCNSILDGNLPDF